MRSIDILIELPNSQVGSGVSVRAPRLKSEGIWFESRPVHLLNFENNVSVSDNSTPIMFQISFLHTKLAN